MKILQPIIISLILVFSISISFSYEAAATDTIKKPSSPWPCPPLAEDETTPPPTVDKDKDGKLDRLYSHIEDNNGNDLQVWCLDHGKHGDFAYYSSAPGRDDVWISGCLLICGHNFGRITVTDGTDIFPNGTNSNGTKIYHVNGTLLTYMHGNWVPKDWPSNSTDKGKDHHFYFNWTSSHWVHDTTTREPFEAPVIIKSENKTLKTSQQMSETEEHAANLFEESFPGFVTSLGPGVEADLSPTFSVSREELIVLLDDGQKTSFVLSYPVGIQIEKITFDQEKKSVNILFPETQHEDYVNLSIPRNLIDHGPEEEFIVLVDGVVTKYDESSTSSYRVLTFLVESDSKQAEIIGTMAIPEFSTIVLFIFAASFAGMIYFTKNRLNILNS